MIKLSIIYRYIKKMSDYTSIEFYDDEFDLPMLELPPPKEILDFNDIIHSLINKNRVDIKPYTIQDILRGKHVQDIIINNE
jgi:hypothetical protein